MVGPRAPLGSLSAHVKDITGWFSGHSATNAGPSKPTLGDLKNGGGNDSDSDSDSASSESESDDESDGDNRAAFLRKVSQPRGTPSAVTSPTHAAKTNGAKSKTPILPPKLGGSSTNGGVKTEASSSDADGDSESSTSGSDSSESESDDEQDEEDGEDKKENALIIEEAEEEEEEEEDEDDGEEVAAEAEDEEMADQTLDIVRREGGEVDGAG